MEKMLPKPCPLRATCPRSTRFALAIDEPKNKATAPARADSFIDLCIFLLLSGSPFAEGPAPSRKQVDPTRRYEEHAAVENSRKRRAADSPVACETGSEPSCSKA